MNNNPTYGPHDQASAPDADSAYIGVDERYAPSELPAGFLARGTNLRFRNRKAETRRGMHICPWMKGDGRTPWSEVYGAAVFSDPNQKADWFLIAADGGVWKTRPNQAATVVPLPAGVTLTADTFAQFVQCFNVLILLRGADNAPLVCNDLDMGFRTIVQTADGVASGLDPIPNSGFGLNFTNRLLLIQNKDELAVSEIQDYTSYLALQNSFRINSGSVDALVALAPFDSGDQNTLVLILFKDTEIYRLMIPVADYTQSVLLPVTDKYGCAAPRSLTKSGKNLFWFAESGITSLTLTELNQVQDTGTQLSDPMLKTFGRINPRYVSGIVSAIWNQCLYVALPLDDATMVGPDLIPFEAVYTGIPGQYRYQVTGLIPGRRYHYVPDPDATGASLSISVGEGLDAEGDFTAESTVATINALNVTEGAGTGVLAQVQPVNVGINNAIAVYDFVNSQWCGADEATGVIAVKQFLKTKFNGVKRLFAIGADGVLRLMEEGYEDEVLTSAHPFPTTVPIASRLVTRGYRCQDLDRKRFLALALQLETWQPRYTITAVAPGVNTGQTYQADVTRDRLAYDIQGKEDWDPTNVNDDHGQPGRLDYGVILPDDAGGLNLGSGIALDLEQASTERVPLDEKGYYLQLEIVNQTGRLTLVSAQMESQPAERLSGVTL